MSTIWIHACAILCERREKLKRLVTKWGHSICKASFKTLGGQVSLTKFTVLWFQSKNLSKQFSFNSSAVIIARWEKRGADENANTLDCPQFLAIMLTSSSSSAACALWLFCPGFCIQVDADWGRLYTGRIIIRLPSPLQAQLTILHYKTLSCTM